jgi:hypothetical protein
MATFRLVSQDFAGDRGGADGGAADGGGADGGVGDWMLTWSFRPQLGQNVTSAGTAFPHWSQNGVAIASPDYCLCPRISHFWRRSGHPIPQAVYSGIVALFMSDYTCPLLEFFRVQCCRDIRIKPAESG